MQSRIIIRDIEPNRVSMDMSMSPRELFEQDRQIGFVYLKTLGHLGLSHVEVEHRDALPSYEIWGSVERAKANVGLLQRHIGLIARYGVLIDDLPEYPDNDRVKHLHREFFGKTLGLLAQETIPKWDETTRLSRAMADITYPLAEQINPDGVAIVINPPQKPWYEWKNWSIR